LVQPTRTQTRPIVHTHSINHLSVSQNNIRREISVYASRPHTRHPRCHIRHRQPAGTAVPRRGRHEHTRLRGSEGPHSDDVQVVGHHYAPHAQRHDVHAVGHSGVECGQDVGVVAAAFPADLVDGEASLRSHPSGHSLGVAHGGGRKHVPAGGDGGGVGAVTVGVYWRTVLECFVHFAIGGFVTAAEVAGSDKLAVTGGGGKAFPGDALTLPVGGREAQIAVVEALAFG